MDTAERLEAWTVDRRVETMLAGFGLQLGRGGLHRDRRVGELSGGQRSRLALAWVLLRSPGTLLLDEPTNHLDDAGIEHLRATLTGWRGPVLLASHDRAFLDETATGLLDLDPSPLPRAITSVSPVADESPGSGFGLTRFTGTYTDYLRSRAAARARWERQYRDEQSELARLRAAERDSHVVGHVDRKPRSEGRASAKFYADRNARVVARRVDDARSRLRDLEAHQVREPVDPLRFRTSFVPRGDRCETCPDIALAASALAVAGRLEPTTLTIRSRDRWLITGSSGSGKSSLLNALAGLVTPTSGTLGSPTSARIGLLTQDVALPDPDARGAARTAAQVYRDSTETATAAALPLSATGLFAGVDKNRPVGILSIGQQRRLMLAILLAELPDVLLLDEPTNHLSLLLVTELEAALASYPGAVVIASHDQWLRRRWIGNRLELRAS